MNTQLASWAELRHDNLLYAKQSYSVTPVCSFPYSYVEPIPGFYRSLKNLANQTIEKFNNLSMDLAPQKLYFNGFALLMDTLEAIAQKELDNIPFADNEKKFLRSILYESSDCATVINGWYTDRLTYQNWFSQRIDHVVADFHTAPADEFGNIVGWVKHAGTGPVNLCVVVADLPGVGNVAFAGPVSSYYECTTINFLRLKDEEWQQTYLANSLRPDWVNIYLANNTGESKGTGSSLMTGIQENKSGNELMPDYNISISNYPNPFNPETTILFNIPKSLSNYQTELNIYNINGELIKKLLSKELPSGNYLVKWNGTNDFDRSVSSGIYFYYLKVGTSLKTGKMNLIK